MFTPLFILAPTLDLQKKAAFARTSFIPEAEHPDLLVIQETPSIGIETIRDLITWSHAKPFSFKQKVVVVLEAGRMTPQAQNALLKTLEEPPEFLQIIMTGTSELGMVETVRSRCRVIRIQPELENSREMEEFFVWPTTISEAIDQAEKLAKDREEAIAWCEKTLIHEKYVLEKSPQSVGALEKVRYLASTITQLKRNMNTKLTIESLFFELCGK